MGTHECFNKGCQSGNSFYMDEKEELWHINKFGHYPKSCPACRNWKKAQVDFQYHCEACLGKRVVPKAKILGYHRYIGVWQPPTLCRLCKEDPERELRKRLNNMAQKMLNDHYYGKSDHPRAYLLDNSRGQWFGRKGKRKLANAREYIESWSKVSKAMEGMGSDANVSNQLREMSEKWGTTTPQMATPDPEFYSKIPDRAHGNQLNHILDHDSLKDMDQQVVLNKLTMIAESSDRTKTMEFRDGKSGYLVKVDIEEGLVAVVHDQKRIGDGPTPPPPPAYLITGYKPKNVIRYTGGKISGLSQGSPWIPNVKK